MILDIEPGDKVVNPSNKDWGIGQVQSIINDKITVNFENAGKKVIISSNIELRKVDKEMRQRASETKALEEFIEQRKKELPEVWGE